MASMSGVGVHDDVMEPFNSMKQDRKFKYVVFKLSDKLTEIEVDRCVERSSYGSYDDFVQSLPDDDCRYVVYDFEYDLGEAGQRSQLVFVVWCPDKAKVRHKMLYASSKAAIKKKLVGISHEVQATDPSELGHDEVAEQVKRKAIK